MSEEVSGAQPHDSAADDDDVVERRHVLLPELGLLILPGPHLVQRPGDAPLDGPDGLVSVLALFGDLEGLLEEALVQHLLRLVRGVKQFILQRVHICGEILPPTLEPRQVRLGHDQVGTLPPLNPQISSHSG